ncbi:flavin reductase family protein [Streptomyces sp. AV19]|uniref:flavin reductase family protein n=1 Tax=Streptomyces sp. AV19 TaxID=2793068 RepID=UPI0018FE5FCA|nr:flavin reductase family protein [Streptomyces sp. AV19]MBH1937209.1 flavin reductase family protein [Streptomyces sp. AV19]MDG4533482.1 flavin reductase family protein [Streptomyces sp. AV19]
MLEQRSFRDILGRFTTGVVLVTAQTPHGPVGMAVNSFTSVSLEPPLIAVCAARSSTTWPAIRSAGGFAITVLGGQHEAVCRAFSTRGADRFTGGEWSFTRGGHPVLLDGLAWLDCRISTIQPAGDHELVVAEALEGALTGLEGPLVFHAGRYTGLAPAPELARECA